MKGADVAIIGAGAAGLHLASKLAERKPDLQIAIFSKTAWSGGASQMAQGGIAAVMESDEVSIRQHIADTLIAGDGLCRKNVVHFVVRRAKKILTDLIKKGLALDYEKDGNLSKTKEGGHAQNIIVHRKDSTGKALIETLMKSCLNHKNIQFFWNHGCTSIEKKNEKVSGLTFINYKTGEHVYLRTSKIVLATGGAGQAFATTTNPPEATGDGIRLATEIGAKLGDMEFVQFHPTALYYTSDNPKKLISEAVRGHGAHILNDRDERYLFKHHPKGELGPRDVLARAITQEMKYKGMTNLWMDARHLSDFETAFPEIHKVLIARNIDPLKNLIPIAPAAHYNCGGITTDLRGQSNIPGLYACGECACTGLHGGNRLASNSLLEALVFSEEIAVHLAGQHYPDNTFMTLVEQKTIIDDEHLIQQLRRNLGQNMDTLMGIVRNNQQMEEALAKVDYIAQALNQFQGNSLARFELESLIAASRAMIHAAQKRKTNKGCHYNPDLSKENN